MFSELLADSIARAIFWLLIMAGATVCLRFLIKDIISYLTEDIPEDKDKGKEKEETTG